MRSPGPTLLLALALAAGVTACGDGSDGGGGGPTTAVPSAAETTTTGAETIERVPESPLVAALTQTYGSETPVVEAGAVTVHWYRVSLGYVALYVGEGIEDYPPLCPGNSMLLAEEQAFEFVRNAETADGGCEGIESNFSLVRVCDLAWMFTTAIPLTVQGQLFASISSPNSDAGVLGSVATGPEVPLISDDAATYEVAEGILAGGETTLRC